MRKNGPDKKASSSLRDFLDRTHREVTAWPEWRKGNYYETVETRRSSQDRKYESAPRKTESTKR
jgi:hypothetical protein